MDDSRSMKDRMLAGELYIADDPELAAMARRARALTHRLNTMDPNDTDGRREVLTQLLGHFGEDSEILPPLAVDYGSNLRMGARSFANMGLVALDVGAITIGDDVQIGPHVQLLTPTHPVEPGPRREKWEAQAPITIGDNVWLGGGVIVCPGVTIGADTVVGAGAVVTKDLPAGVVAVGNPARVVRRLSEESPQAGAAVQEPEAAPVGLTPEQQERVVAMAGDLARDDEADELAGFLDHGLPVDVADPDGNTLLMLAAYAGSERTVRLLLDRGADVDARNARGQSILAGTLFKGEDDIARLLLAAGADVDAGTPTAREAAAMFGRGHLLS